MSTFRCRPIEQTSHAAWFAAAKQQWHSDRDIVKPVATVAEADVPECGAATVPTQVTVEVVSYNKAAAGHIVYVVKVVDKKTRASWTMLKRYTEFLVLHDIISLGCKNSKSHSDLKQIPKFPKKYFNPDLEERKSMLNVWLQDVVDKVAMHVCDDESSRATAAFVGLKASAYLARPELPKYATCRGHGSRVAACAHPGLP